MAIALEEIESQRAALQALALHREGGYDSAIIAARDNEENSFALNYRAMLQWTDLLVDPADPHSFRAESEFLSRTNRTSLLASSKALEFLLLSVICRSASAGP